MSNTQQTGVIEARHIPVGMIDRDPAQPRTDFDETKLHELAESIREHGVIQPIEVEATADGRYVIHHGERRWRASQLAGQETIPAVVAPARAADEKLVRQALENLHREDLNPIDEARVYQGLITLGWSRTRVARETGKSLPTINGRLVWLKLEKEIQHLVALGHLHRDSRLADKLLILPPEVRVPLAEKLARRGLGLKGSMAACDRMAQELFARAEAAERGRERHATRAAAVGSPGDHNPFTHANGRVNGKGAPAHAGGALAHSRADGGLRGERGERGAGDHRAGGRGDVPGVQPAAGRRRRYPGVGAGRAGGRGDVRRLRQARRAAHPPRLCIVPGRGTAAAAGGGRGPDGGGA